MKVRKPRQSSDQIFRKKSLKRNETTNTCKSHNEDFSSFAEKMKNALEKCVPHISFAIGSSGLSDLSTFFLLQFKALTYAKDIWNTDARYKPKMGFKEAPRKINV